MIIRNIRLAVQNYRNWRAQKNMAERATKKGNRKKLEGLADRSRRDFLAASGRAAMIPGLIALVGGGSGLAYYLLARKKQVTAKRISSSQNHAAIPKDFVLNVLKEVKVNNSMSPRYQVFITKIIELIKADKISFAKKQPPSKDQLLGYNTITNTVDIDPTAFELDSLALNSLLIHELFHAFQDDQNKQLRVSVAEAEAHLASCDYLYHHGRPPSEIWVKFLSPSKFGDTYTRVQFNVPSSIIKRNINYSFSSPEYEQTIEEIAYNFYCMHILQSFFNLATDVSASLFLSNTSVSKVKAERRKSLNKILEQPNRHVNITIDRMQASQTFKLFLGTSRYLIEKLLFYKKYKEADHLLNHTFIVITKVFKSFDLSKREKLSNFDGIK